MGSIPTVSSLFADEGERALHFFGSSWARGICRVRLRRSVEDFVWSVLHVVSLYVALANYLFSWKRSSGEHI